MGVIKKNITLLLKPVLGGEPSEVGVSSMLEEVTLRLQEIHSFDEDDETNLCVSGILKYGQDVLNEEVIKTSHHHI